MIKSMTAFAREEVSAPWGGAVWEIRSVNFRYLDVSMRLPEEFRALENEIRERASARLGRGKVDCTLRYHPGTSKPSALRINHELVQQLLAATRDLDEQLGASSSLRAQDLLRWPGVVETQAPDLDEVRKDVLALLDTALDDLVAMREREGRKIADMVGARCAEVAQIAARVSDALPEILQSMRDRIAQRLSEVVEQLDHERLEQEMVIFANRMDVSEELDRLGAHTTEVAQLIDGDKPTGRRLDFLMQEMNREANTLGSKSVDKQMTRASVDLKVLIEQMREQIQNVE